MADGCFHARKPVRAKVSPGGGEDQGERVTAPFAFARPITDFTESPPTETIS
jgi:hypothetical protein